MATLYFNGAVDNDWAELGNWWTDDSFTTQATSLPTSSDSVIASANISSNSGSEPTVVNFTMNDPGNNGYTLVDIAITVTGNATFNGISYINFGTITGDCTFNDGSRNNGGGTVTGDCTFNDSSYSFGFITGDCTFNDNSSNSGAVTGNATFNDSSLNSFGIVNGNATFSLSSAATQISAGIPGVYGSISFAYEKGINGSSILGVI